jgi:ribonuclease T1
MGEKIPMKLVGLALLAAAAGLIFAQPPTGATTRPQPAYSYQAHGRSACLMDSIPVAQLPSEARTTLQRIKSGGPFPYSKDGSIFGNHEHKLPPRPPGYYKEYTVRTPGIRDRGPRRIIAGAGGELFYTDDHYNTFRLIKE